MKNEHVAVLIEDFRGQFKVFGEMLQTTNEKLGALDGRMTRLEDKVDGVAVDMADVKKRLGQVERGVNGVSGRKRK